MNKFTEPEPDYADENLMDSGCFISLAVVALLVSFSAWCFVWLLQ